ncbi:MAG TPA: hypothetical protein VFV87_07685 [Pirellulaceae bacterium]|nr:hypothetical protein [Pirellulaceae bacterium]
MLVCALAAAFSLAVLVGNVAATAAEFDLGLRIAWGGGEGTSWQGTIRLSAGVLADPAPLGLEADDPGSMQVVADTMLRIHPRSPRSYDGCDLRVKAPADAKLLIELAPEGAPPPQPLEIPLAQLLKGVAQFPLDERQNRLLVQRSPGDALRVQFAHEHLVFAPGEKLTLNVEPNPADVTPSTSYLLAASLLYGRSEEQLWNKDLELKTDAGARAALATVEVPLPLDEGVYDVRLAVYPKRLTSTFVRGKPLLTRKVQLVVVAPVKTQPVAQPEWQSILEFDPANPKWWERMTRLPSSLRLPTLPAAPVGSGATLTRTHQSRGWVELAPGAWQAYPLTVTTPGRPHVLEIEYPSDWEQTLSISLVEPNAAGEVAPIGLDSGLDVPAPAAGHTPAVQRHKLIFWPNTRSPQVLLVNRRDDRPALYGQFNLLAGPTELPPLAVPPSRLPGRTLAAYYDRPLVVENFSAAEFLDPASNRCLDDWQTFLDAGRRLIETLQYSGHNAVVLTVASEGSAIYPSSLLEPTPKYDTGMFFESGQDPRRKDVLELLFRLCDRAGINLIPAVQFSSPLPALEALRLAGGSEATGLEPLGPDGRTWLQRGGARRGMGVYYNALDERVQAAMASVVAELANRYGHHASFAGVSVQLGAESYAVLPDETCSYDDATLAAFAQQAAVELPDACTTSLAARSEFLHGEGEEAWLAWRTTRLSTLYSRMRAEVARHRNSAGLYLATGDLTSGRQVQLAMRPSLPERSNPAFVLRLMGIDLQQLASVGIVAPRPGRIVPNIAAARDFHEHWNQSPELDAVFRQGGRATALHVLEPAQLPLPEFDAVSPFGAEKTHTWLVSQIPPAGAAYRERFVRSLAALDAPAIFDGGWLLPLGQEAELAPFAKVFRRLPAEAFATLQPAAGAEQSSEVVVRWLTRGGRTYFYAVNAAPWPVEVAIEFASSQPLRVSPYADDRPASVESTGESSLWTCALQPLDVVGGETETLGVALSGYRVTASADIASTLRDEIRTVRLRCNSLRSPIARDWLANPSFETPSMAANIPGWVNAAGPGLRVEVDRTGGYESKSSLHVVSTAVGERPAPVVWIRSEPFAAPTTGRLSVVAWIRTRDAARQPVLRMAIEGKLDGRTYYRRANVGASEDGLAVKPLTTEWAPYRFPLADLPQSGLTDLRVGFDLMGEGEVWIDNVQVFDLWFESNERDELIKNIATVDVQAGSGQIFECQRFLTSYWPSFLRRHVPLPGATPGVSSRGGSAAAHSAPAPGAPGHITARPAAPKPAGGTPPPPPAGPKEDSPSMVDRLKSWLPKSWR